MGHRANFVVIHQGSARAYRDQWAALGCVYILEDGPEKSREAAEKMASTEALEDWAFAEGGYLLDFDERKVIVFGDLGGEEFLDDELPDGVEPAQEPRAFLEQVAGRWPGWLLRWDDRGVDAFAEHLRARGIETIRTQPVSHPPDRTVVEVQG